MTQELTVKVLGLLFPVYFDWVSKLHLAEWLSLDQVHHKNEIWDVVCSMFLQTYVMW